jgi:hypothetical protein
MKHTVMDSESQSPWIPRRPTRQSAEEVPELLDGPEPYGGWWQADPTDRSVMILLTHNMVTLEQLADGVGLGAWDATTQFQTLGSAFPTNIGESRTC